jgi:ribosomal protein uL22
MFMEYAYNKLPTGRTARARISRVNCSWKDLSEVCRNVRGKDTDYALDFLTRAAEGEQAILFLRHCKSKGHKSELGGKQGGFPVKSCKAVLNVVESANANANKLGLGATKVVHILANKHATYPRMSPKGRRIRHDYEVAFIEVVLEEKQQKAAEVKKNEKPSEKKTEKPVEKKADAAKPVEREAEAPKNAEAAKPVERKADAPKAPAAE